MFFFNFLDGLSPLARSNWNGGEVNSSNLRSDDTGGTVHGTHAETNEPGRKTVVHTESESSERWIRASLRVTPTP